MSITNEVEVKEYTLEIVADSDAENPRHWDNLGVMVCSHRRYTMGDEDGLHDAIQLVCDHFSDDVDDEYDLSDPATVYRLLLKSGKAIVLPLYLYDHSGLTMSTKPFSCPWDSGQVGFIFVSKERVRKEYGWKKVTKRRIEQIESYLGGEVEVYDQYLRGDIWGFRTLEDGEEVDSCWGFYGDDPMKNGIHEHLSEPFRSMAENGDYQHVYA